MLGLFLGPTVELSFFDFFCRGMLGAYTLLYIVSSGFLGSVFSQSIEKKRVKTLVG